MQPSSMETGKLTVDDLPNEVLLEVIPLLPLKSLIAARGVCRHWRALVREAHLCPIRRTLLDLFLDLVCQPGTLSPPRVSQRYAHTDREEYLRFLTRTSPAPADFVLWVREWPAWGVFAWLWPETDDAHCARRRARDLLVQLAHADGAFSLGVGMSGWSEPMSVRKPHVKCVTFSGGKSPFAPGVTLRATRLVPIELANIGILQTMNLTGFDGGEEEEETIEVTVLCFGGGNRALILDGKNGGEELVGIVYTIVEGYTLDAKTILSRTWVEYLRNHLLTPHPEDPPVKFVVRLYVLSPRPLSLRDNSIQNAPIPGAVTLLEPL